MSTPAEIARRSLDVQSPGLAGFELGLFSCPGDGAVLMENGLYHAVLTLPDDVTNCVVSLRDGIIEGGDSVSCFSGTVEFDGDRFTAELITRKYAELDRYLPVFGLLPAKVIIRGRVTGPDTAVGQATCSQAFRKVAQVELRRLRFESADLMTGKQVA